MVFWVVSVPLIESQHNTRNLLDTKLKYQNLADVSSVSLPTLKIGTLDSLLSLSDDLVKINAAVEGAVYKMRRTIAELSSSGEEDVMLVDGLPVEDYLKRFEWNEARFSPRMNLREIVDKIVEEMTRLEDDLKLQMTEYNAIKNTVAQEYRKHQGSLAIKEISTILQEAARAHIDTENLQAVYVVVPRFGEQEFLRSYTNVIEATLGSGPQRFSGVVPGSATQIAAETDYAMYQVVVFKRIADDFKVKARGAGLQVRDYKPPSQADTTVDPAEMQRQLTEKQRNLRQWVHASFSEAFSAFVHLIMVRVFVESILRYGLPPQYQAAVLRPAEKAENKARAVLADEFGTSSADLWMSAAEDAKAGVFSSEEVYPYVSYSISVL